jgi:hypothetical protein
MKKLSLLTLLAAVSFSSFAGDGEMPEKKNAVKLNISSLVYKNIGLQYERALAPKIAVACQIRLMPKGTPGFYNSVENQIQDGTSTTKLSNVSVGSLAITPEFRFYPKHVMKGFYLAPYFRFRNMSMGSTISFVDSSNVNRTMTLDGKLTTFAGGLMIGSHFNIGKSFSLDWFILGAHYSSTKGTLNGSITGSGMNAADQTKLKNDLLSTMDDSKFFKNNEVNVSSNAADLSTKFSLVGLRGFGLNFGYRF